MLQVEGASAGRAHYIQGQHERFQGTPLPATLWRRPRYTPSVKTCLSTRTVKIRPMAHFVWCWGWLSWSENWWASYLRVLSFCRAYPHFAWGLQLCAMLCVHEAPQKPLYCPHNVADPFSDLFRIICSLQERGLRRWRAGWVRRTYRRWPGPCPTTATARCLW